MTKKHVSNTKFVVSVQKHISSKTAEKITAQVKSNMAGDKEKPIARTRNYEFGGPVGVFFMIFLLPAAVYLINLACRKVSNAGRSFWQNTEIPYKVVSCVFFI